MGAARLQNILAAACMASLLAALPAPAMAGSWKFETDERDHPSLSYSQNGKTGFVLACGRAVGLHVRYPGKAGTAGKTFITISNARSSMKFNGEFQETDASDATSFVQWDLGFARQDPELFGPRWKKLYARFLDLIGSGEPLTISSRDGSYRLPAPDAAGWKNPLAICGGLKPVTGASARRYASEWTSRNL